MNFSDTKSNGVYSLLINLYVKVLTQKRFGNNLLILLISNNQNYLYKNNKYYV